MEAIDALKFMLGKIIELMMKTNESEWGKYFKKIHSKCETISGKDQLDQIAREIIGLYSGMGSFNDLIFYKNNQVLIDEMNELKELQKKIFRIATNMLASPSNWPNGKPEKWEE